MGSAPCSGVRRIPHPFVDLIGEKVAKNRQIPETDLELDADSVLFDEELRDGGREHGLGADDGIAGRRRGQGEKQRKSIGSGAGKRFIANGL